MERGPVKHQGDASLRGAMQDQVATSMLANYSRTRVSQRPRKTTALYLLIWILSIKVKEIYILPLRKL